MSFLRADPPLNPSKVKKNLSYIMRKNSKPSAAHIFAMVCLIFDVLITGTEKKLNQGNDNDSRTSDSDDTTQRGIINEV